MSRELDRVSLILVCTWRTSSIVDWISLRYLSMVDIRSFKSDRYPGIDFLAFPIESWINTVSWFLWDPCGHIQQIGCELHWRQMSSRSSPCSPHFFGLSSCAPIGLLACFLKTAFEWIAPKHSSQSELSQLLHLHVAFLPHSFPHWMAPFFLSICMWKRC